MNVHRRMHMNVDMRMHMNVNRHIHILSCTKPCDTSTHNQRCCAYLYLSGASREAATSYSRNLYAGRHTHTYTEPIYRCWQGWQTATPRRDCAKCLCSVRLRARPARALPPPSPPGCACVCLFTYIRTTYIHTLVSSTYTNHKEK